MSIDAAMNYFYIAVTIFWLLGGYILGIYQDDRLSNRFSTACLVLGAPFLLYMPFSELHTPFNIHLILVVFYLFLATQLWKTTKLWNDVRASHRSFK